MSEMSAGTALRNLQQAHAGLKKARQVLRQARGEPDATRRVLKAGWDALAATSRILAAIPLDAASDEVLTKQLSVQRYATALLVRLRRVLRGGPVADGDDDADLDADADD